VHPAGTETADLRGRSDDHQNVGASRAAATAAACPAPLTVTVPRSGHHRSKETTMDARGTADQGPQERGGQDGMPRWVKVFAVTAVALLLLAAVVMILSGGQHGPGRHTSSTGNLDAGSPTASAAAVAGDDRAAGSVSVVSA
jgi:hypothetical protein